MKCKYKSTIEMNPETGRKSLIVFYDAETDDFNEAINQAIAFHNIRDGQMNVIAIPRRFEIHKNHGHFDNTHTLKN